MSVHEKTITCAHLPIPKKVSGWPADHMGKKEAISLSSFFG